MPLKHMGTLSLETKRLLLRRFTMEDAEAMFCNWANDIEVCRFLNWDPHGRIEATKEILGSWTAAYEKNDTYSWAIVLRESNEPIGSIAVVSFNDRDSSCEIGYCIGKNYWSQGIMTESLGAVIRFLFTEVGVNRIQAQHDTQNAASGKVMQNAGMTLEGTLRQRRLRRDGTFGDGNIWSILQDEYRARP